MSANETSLYPAAGRNPATAARLPGAAAGSDKVFRTFLEQQCEQGLGLAGQSDVLRLTPIGATPPQHYLAAFHCLGAARVRGEVVIARRRHVVGIFIPTDYLRRAQAQQVLTWLEPANIYSPHIRPPFICTGRILPGTCLVDLLYQVYEIILFYKVTPREDDALNQAACAWARSNLGRFPLERTPLKRPVSTGPAPLPAKQS